MNIEQAKQILIKYYKKQYYKMLANNFKKKDIDFLKVKFRHSFDCYNIVKNIIEEDKILKEKNQNFKNKLEIACLLHDIGRFFELTNELDTKPHGDFGADLLEYDENLKDKLILIAIRHHDKGFVELDDDKDYKTLTKEEKENALDILLALRDADKISNLYLFKLKNTVYTRKEVKYGFSEEYFIGLENKHLIDKKYKNTIFDSITYYIIWYHELIFDGSKEFVIKNKLINHLLNMFEFYINSIYKKEIKNKENRLILEKSKIKMRNHLNKIKNILIEQNII